MVLPYVGTGAMLDASSDYEVGRAPLGSGAWMAKYLLVLLGGWRCSLPCVELGPFLVVEVQPPVGGTQVPQEALGTGGAVPWGGAGPQGVGGGVQP